jgi:hypothetical protein
MLAKDKREDNTYHRRTKNNITITKEENRNIHILG